MTGDVEGGGTMVGNLQPGIAKNKRPMRRPSTDKHYQGATEKEQEVGQAIEGRQSRPLGWSTGSGNWEPGVCERTRELTHICTYGEWGEISKVNLWLTGRWGKSINLGLGKTCSTRNVGRRALREKTTQRGCGKEWGFNPGEVCGISNMAKRGKNGARDNQV